MGVEFHEVRESFFQCGGGGRLRALYREGKRMLWKKDLGSVNLWEWNCVWWRGEDCGSRFCRKVSANIFCEMVNTWCPFSLIHGRCVPMVYGSVILQALVYNTVACSTEVQGCNPHTCYEEHEGGQGMLSQEWYEHEIEGWGQWQESCVMCPHCTVKTQYLKTARLSDYRIAQKRYKSFYKRSTSVNLVHFQIHPSHDVLLTTSYTTQDYTATHILVLYPFVGQGRLKLCLISLSQAMCTRHCATQICTNYTWYHFIGTSSPSHDNLNPHLYIYISITLILIVNNIILFFQHYLEYYCNTADTFFYASNTILYQH